MYMRSNMMIETWGRERESRNMSSNMDKNYKLKRRVDLFSGIALIVGTMIGACLRL